MTQRKLRTWARAYFRALDDADERRMQEHVISLAIGVCIGALAYLIIAMVVYWPFWPA